MRFAGCGGASFAHHDDSASGIFDDLDEVAKRVVVARFRVDEEDGGATRTGARGFIDDIESGGLHVIEGTLRADDAEGDVGEATTPAVLVEQFLDRGFGGKGLEKLYQVRSVADLEQGFAHLISAADFFAMYLAESQ